MGKLHELLAVESSMSDQSDKLRAELIDTLTKKRNHFAKKVVTTKYQDPNVEDEVEEQLGMQSTVPKELDWISGHIVKAIDAAAQVDEANTKARADIVLEDGTIMAKNIPATQLLQLAKRLNEVKQVAEAIPTLDPSRGFVPDPASGEGVYKTREEIKPKTKKNYASFVAHPGTDKHPPQVTTYQEDQLIGKYHIFEWSSFLTVSDKANILSRIEDLIRAVRKARARANDVDVDHGVKLGAKLLAFAFKNEKPAQ
jgi:hypothetical protein